MTGTVPSSNQSVSPPQSEASVAVNLVRVFPLKISVGNRRQGGKVWWRGRVQVTNNVTFIRTDSVTKRLRSSDMFYPWQCSKQGLEQPNLAQLPWSGRSV